VSFSPKCDGCPEKIGFGEKVCEFRKADGSTLLYHRECCPTCDTRVIIHAEPGA
jgi:hypothetical protein